jgi:hypothetical protein
MPKGARRTRGNGRHTRDRASCDDDRRACLVPECSEYDEIRASCGDNRPSSLEWRASRIKERADHELRCPSSFEKRTASTRSRPLLLPSVSRLAVSGPPSGPIGRLLAVNGPLHPVPGALLACRSPVPRGTAPASGPRLRVGRAETGVSTVEARASS